MLTLNRSRSLLREPHGRFTRLHDLSIFEVSLQTWRGAPTSVTEMDSWALLNEHVHY